MNIYVLHIGGYDEPEERWLTHKETFTPEHFKEMCDEAMKKIGYCSLNWMAEILIIKYGFELLEPLMVFEPEGRYVSGKELPEGKIMDGKDFVELPDPSERRPYSL